MTGARRGPVAVVLLVVLATAGCGIALPDDGPVFESTTTGSGNRLDAMTIDPVGPRPGQSPSEVVKGFLDAMLATPVSDTVARQFLASDSRSTWNPDATIVYDSISLPAPDPKTDTKVDVTLSGAVAIDDRGTWQGLTGSGLQFRVVKEGEDWRISLPKDALIVPRLWYTQRFRQVSLYFFDPTSQVLVPDPVFVPRGVDLASILVRRLIAGPSPDLVGFSRNLLPTGVDPEISVPVSDDGVATIDLGDVTAPGPLDQGLLLAQLAWTLREDPSVDRIKVLVDGEPLTLPGQGSTVSVTAGSEFAPYVANAEELLYGVDGGLLVSGSPQSMVPVSGPFGQADLGLRTITPDLAADRAAGVSTDGRALYVGPVRASDSGEVDKVVPVITDGVDLLTPSWDFSDRLWMVDRNGGSARVFYLRGGHAEEVFVDGISSKDVKSFLVSRDGSRLVAVLRGTSEDEVVVSRLLYTEKGRVVRATLAQQVDVEGGRHIKDIAWLSPTSIVVLHPIDPVGDRLFQVRTASVDGAPGGPDDLSLTLEGRVLGLTGTPNPAQTTYAVTRDTLIDLSGPTAGNLEVEPGVTSIGYVG